MLTVSSSLLLVFGFRLSNAQPTYFVISDTIGLSQSDAQLACEAQNGTLATLHSDSDYASAAAACMAVCSVSSVSSCGCWLGIKDDASEGVWYNTDNSYPDYLFQEDGTAILGQNQGGTSAWYANPTSTHTEPNNLGDEDCAHIWRPQSYWVNDIRCSYPNNYPLCRKTNEDKQQKCAPGWDNVPIGEVGEGECQIPLECWGQNTNHLLGDNSGASGNGLNDISGCGLQSCTARYDLDTIEQCSVRCATTTNCVAYTWAPYSGDQNHAGVKVCTLYDSTTATQQWETNQIFCSRCDLSVPGYARAQEANDVIDVQQPVQPDSPASQFDFDNSDLKMLLELLAMNAAVSALVSMVVVGVCLCACYACSKSTKAVTYEKVDNNEDVAMNL